VGVDDEEDATDEPGDETDGSAAPKKKKKSSDSKNKTDPDALNLAGLLNVLDGVVDSPGRIVVLTTNHPEKLDPALIRPGRINFTVELGHMKAEPLQQLIQHLVQEEMTDAQRDLAATIASESRVVPAQVEQLCAETDGIDELLARLHQMAGPGSKGQKVSEQPSEHA
jgi:chaperone BCS1